MTTVTTGIGADVAVALDTDSANHTLSLSLSGVSTHQFTATLKDVAGTTQSASQSFSYVSRSPYVATVSAGGLISAAHLGSCTVETAYPWFNGNFPTGSDGLPTQKVYNEVIVTVKA
jgi:Bacterial Ig-like domain (group 2)